MLLLRVEVGCLVDLRSVAPAVRGHLVLQYEQPLICGIVEVVVIVVML
jgi:hypothetical protein